MSDEKMDKATLHCKKIDEYLKTHDYIMNADVRELCVVSAATASQILSQLIDKEKLIRNYFHVHWVYKKKL